MIRSGVLLLSILAAHIFAFAEPARAQSVVAPSLPAAAAECAARLRAASAPGEVEAVPRVADICPSVARELEEGTWAETLGAIRAGQLTSRPFAELVDLMGQYERSAFSTGPALEQLDEIVESLRPFEPKAEPSLWGRVRQWLRERLGFDDSNDGGGLIEWLRNLSIPDEWVRTIFYVLGITIVLAVLVVVANELRVRGVFGNPAGARARGAAGVVPAWEKRMPLSLDVVTRAPPTRQPALLLAMLVERLRARFGDDVRDSMTHRELAAAASVLGVRRSGELKAVLSAAERVAFAGWRPDPADIEPVIANGKAVLDELDGDREPATASPR